MRPYLAIVKDSFREALASRVLWILLLLTTLLLAALAPIGLDEQIGVRFTPADIIDSQTFLAKVRAQQAQSRPSPGKQVWNHFDAAFETQAENPAAAGDGEPRRPRRESLDVRLSEELNRLLKQRELYDPTAWKNVSLDADAEALVKRGVERLSDDELSRLNRLLLEAAFPESIVRGREPAVTFSYFGKHPFETPLPLKQKLLIDGALSGFMNLFVGVIGVFTAILVTASIIPQTFAPGAIDLLLSKPISRSLLYLTKFLGGCMFTLINGAYLIGGLWLLVGLRFGQWNDKLLLCIPVFMFLFAIYYAVSALAGAVWKNAIVSVVITILFWGACFTVGTVKGVVEAALLSPQRLVKLVPAGEDLIAANERGEAFRWLAADRKWQPILQFAGGGDAAAPPFGFAMPLVGPAYDRQHERIFALVNPASPFRPARGNLLRIGERADDWQRIDGVAPPAATAALFVDPQGRLLAATSGGVYRLEGEPTEKQRRVKVFGVELPAGATGSRFALVSPALRLHTPLAAAMDPASGAMALFDGDTLVTLSLDQRNRYRTAKQDKLEKAEAGVVALAGQTLLLSTADGWTLTLDPADFKRSSESRPEGKTAPRFAEASADGRYFAVLSHNRKLYLYDAQRREMSAAAVAGQGDISAVAFAGDRLLVADEFTRVSEYRLPEFALERRYAPSRSMLEQIYFYAIKPLYTVFPKPGELDNLVNYLLTEETSVAMQGRPGDLQSARIAIDVWGPVWSSLAFVAVAVAAGCWYTARKDF